MNVKQCELKFVLIQLLIGFLAVSVATADDDLKLVKAVEQQRIKAINQVIGSVVAIYDDDRQGGGSGVIIDPSGIALTNHHVIMGAGVTGWGGISDGELYRWKLIGTDPGGDVAMIQMEGRDNFPFTPLGDSDAVRVGDWALAMGNPFILTEDQSPTVTLGIVSGVKRYQPGAGMNQLVYGNCIQVDSSINPGNSGGPLFNLNGEVIGINGRGSFKERGRVNVGLGYAISSNQIKNFIPDLLATKLVEHATLDASFSERQGKVVCSRLNLDAPVAKSGLKLGDELLEFEGIKIKNANQFTNLICTLPADWPAELKIRKPDASEHTIVLRCYGLPYKKPRAPSAPPKSKDGKRNPEQEKQYERAMAMVRLLSAAPGKVRHKKVNQTYVKWILADWKKTSPAETAAGMLELHDELLVDGKPTGSQKVWLAADGRVRVETTKGELQETFVFDGKRFFYLNGEQTRKLSLVEAKLNLHLVQALAMVSSFQKQPFEGLGAAMIDGADKAKQQNAYRLKMLDEDSDHFFYWMRMYGDDGLPATQLLKASANKECEDSGGVTFSDWKKAGPVSIPIHREFVFGLAEESKLSLVNKLSKWSEETDVDLFFVEWKEDEEDEDDDDRLNPFKKKPSAENAKSNEAIQPDESGESKAGDRKGDK